MSSVKKLKQIECFSSANFTKDDAVGSMPKRCFQQVADRHRRNSRLGLSSLEADEVWFFELNLRGVLDEQNSVVVSNELSEGAVGVG